MLGYFDPRSRKTRVGIVLPRKLYRQVCRLADERRMWPSGLIEEILVRALADLPRKPRKGKPV